MTTSPQSLAAKSVADQRALAAGVASLVYLLPGADSAAREALRELAQAAKGDRHSLQALQHMALSASIEHHAPEIAPVEDADQALWLLWACARLLMTQH